MTRAFLPQDAFKVALTTLISYKTMAATPEVVDLSLVQSVVGRMADGKDIFILDRSGPLANVEYVGS